MKHYLYSVRDQKAEAYLPVFQCGTDGIAQRTFSDAVNQKGHTFNLHPEDYTLVLVGSVDDNTGQVTPVDAKTLGIGIHFLQQSVHPHQKSDSEL